LSKGVTDGFAVVLGGSDHQLLGSSEICVGLNSVISVLGGGLSSVVTDLVLSSCCLVCRSGEVIVVSLG